MKTEKLCTECIVLGAEETNKKLSSQEYQHSERLFFKTRRSPTDPLIGSLNTEREIQRDLTENVTSIP